MTVRLQTLLGSSGMRTRLVVTRNILVSSEVVTLFVWAKETRHEKPKATSAKKIRIEEFMNDLSGNRISHAELGAFL
jgi:hypothetical protein